MPGEIISQVSSLAARYSVVTRISITVDKA